MMQNPQPRIDTSDPLYGSLSHGDPYSSIRPAPTPSQSSPPSSQHQSGSTDNSLSSQPFTNRSVSATASHLSSASSISRASDGANFYSPTASEFGRGTPSSGGPAAGSKQAVEETLQRHYGVLKRYLLPYLRADAANNRTTKARDKLLRLSATQFHELSTDVFDELLRREEDRKRPGGGVPPFLLPKNSFHPKRNQARQKLSTLPPDRFRQLATDVLYELERRIPRFANIDFERPGSAASGVRTSGRPGPPGGPPHGFRGHPSNSSNGFRGPPPSGMRPNGPMHPRNGSQNHSPIDEFVPPPRVDSRARSGSLAQGNNTGRPVPQTFQSSTIVPNKSTMVEDDETDEEDGAVGLDRILDDKRSTIDSSNPHTTQAFEEYEARISQLQERIQELQEQLQSTEAEVQTSRTLHEDLSTEKESWTKDRADLDTRLLASQQSLENLHSELEQVHTERSQTETELRANTERAVSDLQLEVEELRKENESLRQQQQQQQQQQDENHTRQKSSSSQSYGLGSSQDTTDLQAELETQRALTEQVRQDSLQFLAEMRQLSAESSIAAEKEDHLLSQISAQENELEHWKSRYAKARTQIRGLKGGSIGLGIQHHSESMLRSRHSFNQAAGVGAVAGANAGDNGLVRNDGSGLVDDVDVTTFQLSIDELLYAARDANTELALEKSKPVIKAVRAIVANIDGDSTSNNSPTHSSSRGSQPSGTAGPGSTSTSTGPHSQHPTALKARISRDANKLVTAARTHAISHGVAPVSLLDAAASNLTASVVALLLVVGIRPSEDGAHAFDNDDDLDNQSSVSGGTSSHLQPQGLRINNDQGASGNLDLDFPQPLHLQPRSFGDSSHADAAVPAQLINHARHNPPLRHLDEGMESPVIVSGFVGRPQSPPYQSPTSLPQQHSGIDAKVGEGVAKDGKEGGLLGSGWFNMLKSPASSHRSSEEGESEDERYGFA